MQQLNPMVNARLPWGVAIQRIQPGVIVQTGHADRRGVGVPADLLHTATPILKNHSIAPCNRSQRLDNLIDMGNV